MTRLGRNDPCWCGSGQKFKKCHISREKQELIRPSQVFGQLEKVFRSRKECLHPQAGRGSCHGKIIRAHTVQRSGGLSRIAESGHVLTVSRRPMAGRGEELQLDVEEIGYHDASTFTGFCSKHDGMFAPVENSPFVGSKEQAFLLGYRAICMELFKKKVALKGVSLMRDTDRGMEYMRQAMIQNLADGAQEGMSAAVRDLEADKREYDEVLMSGDYVRSNAVVVLLDRAPAVMCSGATGPEFDLSGNAIQHLDELAVRVRSLAFSLVGTDSGGAAVFQWVGDNPSAKAVAMGFAGMPRGDLPDALCRYSFETLENVFISPVWWRDLSDEVRQRYLRYARVGLPMGEEPGRQWLSGGGIKTAPFDVVDVVCHV